MASSSDRLYEDFVPKHEMSREPATHTLSVDLSDEGYKKEHIRVQMVHSQRRLIVRGERPAAGDRWRRFRLELRIPDGCDAKAIHARFENGVVRVTMPGAAPEPVLVETNKQQDPASPPTTPKPASPPSSAQDQKDGGRAAPAGEGEEEDKQKDEVAAQKQETVRQRVGSAKDGGGRDDGTAASGGVGVVTTTAASSPRHGYYGFGFVPGRKMVVTTVIGVVFVLGILAIYIRYSVSP